MIEPGSITHKIVTRRVGELLVDPRVQRTLKKARVDKMAATFNDAALGVLTTSYRSASGIYIIDGQHRYRAAEAAGWTGPIETMEYHGLDSSQEAALFRMLNATEKVSAVDRFQVACVEGNPASLQIAKYLDNHGWGVGANATSTRVSAITALERVYALKPEAADGVLGVVTGAWGHRPASVQGAIIEGLGKVLAKHAVSIDFDDLIKKLSVYPGGPDAIIGNARGQAASRAGNVSRYVAKVIIEIYNIRRRSTALPEWQQ